MFPRKGDCTAGFALARIDVMGKAMGELNEMESRGSRQPLSYTRRRNEEAQVHRNLRNDMFRLEFTNP